MWWNHTRLPTDEAAVRRVTIFRMAPDGPVPHHGVGTGTFRALRPAHVTPRFAPRWDHFRTAVLGTVFARRMDAVHRLHVGDSLILVPDPPCAKIPAVWVHARGGDVVGHVPNPIADWLAPWMLAGGRCRAHVEAIRDDSVASWKRVMIVIDCG